MPQDYSFNSQRDDKYISDYDNPPRGPVNEVYLASEHPFAPEPYHGAAYDYQAEPQAMSHEIGQSMAPDMGQSMGPDMAYVQDSSYGVEEATGPAPEPPITQLPPPRSHSRIPSTFRSKGAVAAAKPAKSHGWILAIVCVLSLLFFMMFCVNSCSSFLASFVAPGSASSVIEDNTVAIIDMDGTIQYDGSACSPEGLSTLLNQAEEDDRIKAVVLRVNSGGGVATAGEEMSIAVEKFSKPIVVSSASINASAAYEISSQADYIYVAKTTEIGSIGTVMEVTDLSGLLKMLGVDVSVISSASSKDSSYGYRPLTQDERAYYQRMVDQINQSFIDTVAKGRSMAPEKVKSLATGLVFTGIDAVENGLADAIGTRQDALDKAAKLAGIESYETYNLRLSSYDLGALSAILGSSDNSLEALKALIQKDKSGQLATSLKEVVAGL